LNLKNKGGTIMPVKAKYIKDLPLKRVLDGSESLLVQDLNGTQQAPLGTIVDEIKQNSQEKIREIESELNQTNTQLSAIKEHCTGGNGMQEHSHVNKTVLDKFTDSNGSIFYGEKELGGAIKAGSITDDLIAESIKNAYPTNAFKCNLISGNNMTWLQLNCVLENPTSSLIIDTEQIVSYVSNGLTDNCAIWARVSGGDYCKTTNEKLVLGKLITQSLTVPNPNLKTNLEVLFMIGDSESKTVYFDLTRVYVNGELMTNFTFDSVHQYQKFSDKMLVTKGLLGEVIDDKFQSNELINSKVSYDDFDVVTGATWFKGAISNWSGMWHRFLNYRFEKNEFALNNGDIAVFKMKIRCKNPQHLNAITGLRLWHNNGGAPDFNNSYAQINQQTREYTIKVTIASSQETYYKCDLAIVVHEDYYEEFEAYVFDVTVENKTTGKIFYDAVANVSESSTLKNNQEFTMIGARMDDVKITSNDLEESYIPSIKNKKIICAGDSLTNGYNGANNSYVQYVQNFYPDCTVLNKGSNGGGTARLVNLLTDMARDGDGTVYPIGNLDYSDCIAVIINIGTNGGVSGNKDTSIPQLVEKTVEDIPFQHNGETIDTVAKYWSLFKNDWWGNMGLLVEYIKWKNPRTQIFLTPPTVNGISDTSGSSPFKIREAMRELGDMYGLTVIDVIQGLGINKRNNHLFRLDYCHGTDLRNEMVGKYIAKQIYSHIYDF
jgi:lysophospholipase L1-like esterase